MSKMPAHIQQWRRNRAFLQTIGSDYPDWAVTVTFYTALHAVDALLSHDSVRGVESHSARNRTLMRTQRYEKIWKAYRPLHDLSQTVRYLAAPSKWVPWNQIEQKVIKGYLYPIEQSVQKLIGQDLGLPPINLAASTQ